ncbi:sulfotransferase family 2 domain-containing protein [Glaciecola sp. KUL10]|uniref:sulfotransferase family 2 domain-containing protein n=1 Tax=Glaciecola sp. (strain KUL10) TaxID=2161813 RepID=UPI000D785C88|nr:sulfotransferase family 2 domain-containing protein [Glaciecola sp. KUL10]GBL04241.1 hypothetical protein KUL10_15470 [Glaciecola sp. KUL10]
MAYIYIIIPVFNNLETTQRCFDALDKYRQQNPLFKVVCVNDGSDNETSDYLRSKTSYILIENNSNQGYLDSTNKGLSFAISQDDCDSILLFNNDVYVNGKWLHRLNQLLSKVEIVGYFGPSEMPEGRSEYQLVKRLEFSCALFSRETAKAIGLLDPSFSNGYYSDDDYCLRALLLGFKLGQARNTDKIEHLCGSTIGKKRTEKLVQGAKVFKAKWSAEQNEITQAFLKDTFFDYSEVELSVRQNRVKSHWLYTYLRDKKDFIKTWLDVKRSVIRLNIPQTIIEKKIIFIHVPRTAGSSMVQSGFEEVFGHVPYTWYLKRDYAFSKRAFSFAFVRNPWDRVYSAYQYLSGENLNGVDRVFFDKYVKQFNGFEDFVLNGLQQGVIQEFMHFIPQYKFLVDAEGNLGVTYVGRFETLNDDFQTVCNKLNIDCTLKKVNASNKGSYRLAYSPDARDKVLHIYHKDIEMFNYEF